MSDPFDVIILGAGAAGLMCARIAGLRGKRVLLIERAEKPGKKILISGGGRCNFTNIGAGPANYLSANRHFAKSALARYTPRDFLALVERYGIAWHKKRWASCFAMVPRGRSSICCWRNVAGEMWICAAGRMCMQ